MANLKHGGIYASRNGHELFFRTEDNEIMVAGYAVKGDSFVADKPQPAGPKLKSQTSVISPTMI